MKTVNFEFINPPSGVSLWAIAYSPDLTNNNSAQWPFTSWQTIDGIITATMPDSAWLVLYAGNAGQQANYGFAAQKKFTFVEGATYIWNGANQTLMSEEPGEPGEGGGFMAILTKYAVPISIGAVLLGLVATRRRNP